MKKQVFFILLLLISLSISAQDKQIVHYQQIWSSYLNQTKLNNRWGLWSEMQLKTQDHFTYNFSSTELNLGAIYYINKDLKFINGYTFVNQFPAQPRTINLYEHRPWQMLQWTNNLPRSKFTQWVRLEERFKSKYLSNNSLAEGYEFSSRFRYNVFFQTQIGKKRFAPGTFSFLLANEIYLNIGQNTTQSSFDQERLFLGCFYHVNKHDNLQFGFTKVYQQISSNNKFKSIDVLKLAYFNNLDFSSK